MEPKMTEMPESSSSDQYFRSIIENIVDGYYEVDLAGKFIYFNEPLRKILGYEAKELAHMNYREYTVKYDAERIYQTFNKVFQTGNPTKLFDWEVACKNGENRCVEASISLIKKQADDIIGFRGIVRDVTEKKKMETELVQTKKFLENIFDSSIDGIVTTDLKGVINYISPKTKKMLGYDISDDQALGEKVYHYYGNGIDEAQAIMKGLMTRGELKGHELKMVKNDGELIDISMSASLLKNEKGDCIGTLGIFRDITERKRLETQLQHAQRMQSIGTLAAGIAHNFNNMLMAIGGYVSLLLVDAEADNPQTKMLKNIEKYIQSGSRLTQQLIGYAREGVYPVHILDVNRIIKVTADTFHMTRKKVNVQLDTEENLYPLKGDPSHIEQALMNLFVNAAEAMPRGGDLLIKTRNIDHEQINSPFFDVKPGQYIHIIVSDNGAGIDPEHIDRIFEPFFTTKSLESGGGLGLSSVYGIVKAHEGYVDVESKKGEGTTFNIYFPSHKKEIRKVRPPEDFTMQKTIMLVDDEDYILDVGKQMLKTLGYDVLLAKSGEEAVLLYQQHIGQVDLVILDVIMPGMDGEDTFEALMELDKNVNVLIASGYSVKGQAQDLIKRGCKAFMQKPFNIHKLSDMINNIFNDA